MNTLVVVPAFNEEKSIVNVIQAVRETGLDVIVVNDGSSDKTAHMARSEGVRVLTLPFNAGVGSALRCGFRYAVDHGYDAVIQVDADGQHSPDEASKLIEVAEGGLFDLVIGSRFANGADVQYVSSVRRIPMRIISRVASRAAGTTLTDVTSGFRLISGELLKNFSSRFPQYYLGDTFEATYVAGKAGYRIAEVPVVMSPRTNGRSSASVREAILMIAKTLVVTVFGLHFRIPHKASQNGMSV